MNLLHLVDNFNWHVIIFQKILVVKIYEQSYAFDFYETSDTFCVSKIGITWNSRNFLSVCSVPILNVKGSGCIHFLFGCKSTSEKKKKQPVS